MKGRDARDRTARRILFSLSLLGALVAAPPLAAAPYTPPIWREIAQLADGTEVTGKLVGWNRDRNQNFIDDLIDERIAADPAGTATFDLIVDFNRCVTCCATSADGEEEVVDLLRKVGTLDYLGRYVTYAVVLGVAAADVALLASREEVAMIESLEPVGGTLDVSVAAIRVRASGTFSPNTVQDAFPAITGAGGNIAVLDTGADDAAGAGTTHVMLPAGTFVGGANCVVGGGAACVLGNPDDDHGHGTHVSGIALGRSTGCGGPTCRGVAPGAGLVDIKILDQNGFSVGASFQRGVELAIAQRSAWNIRVLNLSVGDCAASNGVNAAAQLLNTAVMHGIVVVVAAGNAPNCSLPNNSVLINSVASASLAITVAAADDGNTVPLGNDILAGFSLRGPRLSDNDGDPRDEQKPEISAPGTQIRSAQFNTTNTFVPADGTSQAAPHVAGAAALLLQASPGLNPGSVKEVLIASAVQSNKPGPHPGWNAAWGFGFLNMHAALARTLVTDVGRPTNPPYPPCNAGWCSPHISTASAPKINQANTITAQVRNFGGVAANNVRVCFGVYVFSNNNNLFHELGCQQVNIPAVTTQPVQLAWTPSPSLIPPGFPIGQALHTCIKVSIDYAFDTVATNNDMQRNTSVATASVARVPFRLENNTAEPVEVRLKITNSNSKWSVRVFEKGVLLDDPVWVLEPTDCPHDLIVELEPAPGTPVGDKAQVVIQALAANGEDFGGIVIDGIHVDHTLPGSLGGRVTDAHGEGLPGVTLKVQDAGGTTLSSVTDTSGAYRLSLTEGDYTVTLELVGCGTVSRGPLRVDPGQATVLDVVLPCAEALARAVHGKAPRAGRAAPGALR